MRTPQIFVCTAATDVAAAAMSPLAMQWTHEAVQHEGPLGYKYYPMRVLLVGITLYFY